MHSVWSTISVVLCVALGLPGISPAQEAGNAGPKYKLTIVEGASTSKRAKKGRVSSQAVVKITDQNNVPVSGIAVSFALPQLTSGAPAFANSALTSVVTTNTAGVASSGAFTADAGSTFSVSVTASVPDGSVLTTAVPITTVGVATAAGISTGVIVAVVAGVGAAVAGGLYAGGVIGGGGKAATVTVGTPHF
jgi:hypothetical protein